MADCSLKTGLSDGTVIPRSKLCPNCRKYLPSSQYTTHLTHCTKSVKNQAMRQTYRTSNKDTPNRVLFKNNVPIMSVKAKGRAVSSYQTNMGIKRSKPSARDQELVVGKTKAQELHSISKTDHRKDQTVFRKRFTVHCDLAINQDSTPTPRQTPNETDTELKLEIKECGLAVNNMEAGWQSPPVADSQQRVMEVLEQPLQNEEKKSSSGDDSKMKEDSLEESMNSQAEEFTHRQSEGSAQEKTSELFPKHSGKPYISNQIRIHEVQKHMIKKYNESPERICRQDKSVDRDLQAEGGHHKSVMDIERQREHKMQARRERERERERERQKQLEKKRQLQRQRELERQDRRLQEEQRLEEMLAQRAQEAISVQQAATNTNPAVGCLQALIQYSSHLIAYVQNFTLGDCVLGEMLGQLSNLNTLANSIGELFIANNSEYRNSNASLNMLIAYARRTKEIQTTIFRQIEIVLLTNFARFGDQALMTQFTQHIGEGLRNIESIRFPEVVDLSLLTKFSASQIEALFPPKLAIENAECSICLEEIRRGRKIKQLQCKHIFHPDCVQIWLLESRKCPLCRQEQLTQHP